MASVGNHPGENVQSAGGTFGVGLGVDEDGGFSTAVRLSRGVNTIEVIARNTDGQVLRVQRTVIYSP